jgi:hypothetical protein
MFKLVIAAILFSLRTSKTLKDMSFSVIMIFGLIYFILSCKI